MLCAHREKFQNRYNHPAFPLRGIRGGKICKGKACMKTYGNLEKLYHPFSPVRDWISKNVETCVSVIVRKSINIKFQVNWIRLNFFLYKLWNPFFSLRKKWIFLLISKSSPTYAQHRNRITESRILKDEKSNTHTHGHTYINFHIKEDRLWRSVILKIWHLEIKKTEWLFLRNSFSFQNDFVPNFLKIFYVLFAIRWFV